MKKSKLILLISAAVLSINIVNAQTVKPQFKGGKEALIQYINERSGLILTDEPGDDVVSIRFLVGKTGIVSSVTVISGPDETVMGKGALSLVKTMPKWIPGKKKGVATAMYDTLNITAWTPPVIVSDEGDDNAYIAIDIAELQEHKVVVAEPSDREKPFIVVEQMPQYPGGQEEMMKFISDNLKYPEVAAKEGIEGRVILRFVVRKDGNVSDVEVLRGLDPSCDKEAVRVIKSMPKWIPGRQNGQAVDVYFTLPVRFKLTREEDEEK